MRILLDTCAIVYAIASLKDLSTSARLVLEAEDTTAFYSPLSCAEIACLAARGRIELDRHWKRWFNHFVPLNGWRVLDVDLKIVEEAYSLPGIFHADPVDRILIATARIHDLVLVTRDRKILDYPHVNAMW